MSTDPAYPIGRFEKHAAYSAIERQRLIQILEQAPAKYRAAVNGLGPTQLDAPYRTGGWTIRQVLHHVPDSHINAYVRIKLALTEDQPSIKPYDEAAWATLPDTPETPIEVSLALLEALHARWVKLLGALEDHEWQRQFVHPVGGPYTIEQALANYAWHSEHHLAHITNLREQKNW